MGFHSAADWQEAEPLPGIHRRVLSCGDQLMVVQFRIDRGAEVPLHTHPHEQIGHVVSGKVRFFIGDTQQDLAPGDGYSIPSGVPHGCVALEEAVAVDSFHPVREDYR